MIKNNIKYIKSCYGCGVCAVSCPKKIIDIKLNVNGFYEPKLISETECINCGLCLKNCSYIDDDILYDKPIKWNAGWSKDPVNRQLSSSGAVAYELSILAIELGFQVIGVRYNVDENKAEYIICNDKNDIQKLRGSKYLQSNLSKVLGNINRKKRYLIFATPCQISSVKKYLTFLGIEDNCILVDFFCHGVPSYNLWKKYLKNCPQKPYTDLLFRSKVSLKNMKRSWHDSFVITINNDNKYESSSNEGDLFYKYFLGDYCHSKSCYSCKFKMYASNADIRLGDAWGDLYKDNDDGVSAILINSIKGENFIKQANKIVYENVSLESLSSGQMKKSPLEPEFYNIFNILIKSKFNLRFIDLILKNCNKFKNYKRRLYGFISRSFNNA